MKANSTKILVIQDRSGSMSLIAQATIDGYNEFIKGQKGGPGEASVRLVQFDNEYIVRYDKPVAEVEPLNSLTFVPCGGTALLDAMGRGISELGAELAALPEDQRPEKVVVVIMTDGQENQSLKFSRVTVAGMVKHQESAYKWVFLYLGANQDAIAEAQQFGIMGAFALSYNATPESTRASYALSAASVLRARAGLKPDFTEAERAEALRK